MEIASRTPTPQQPQKPAPRGDMPSASVGGNRPADPLAVQSRPSGMGGSGIGAIRDVVRNQRMR